eukprot:11444696-Prorocentrum_lima.AAC.1
MCIRDSSDPDACTRVQSVDLARALSQYVQHCGSPRSHLHHNASSILQGEDRVHGPWLHPVVD